MSILGNNKSILLITKSSFKDSKLFNIDSSRLSILSSRPKDSKIFKEACGQTGLIKNDIMRIDSRLVLRTIDSLSFLLFLAKTHGSWVSIYLFTKETISITDEIPLLNSIEVI